MIQRIQTVYLFLGAMALGAMFLLDQFYSSAPAVAFGWFLPAAALLAGLTAAGALAAIFLYGTRKRQRALVAGLQVLAALLTVLLFVSYYAAGTLNFRTGGGAFDVGKAVFLVLPVVAYLFFLLARRAIRRDIELVRSMDRLR